MSPTLKVMVMLFAPLVLCRRMMLAGAEEADKYSAAVG